MQEFTKNVNTEVLQALRRVERLAKLKARIVEVINAKIDTERRKIALIEEAERRPCRQSFEHTVEEAIM